MVNQSQTQVQSTNQPVKFQHCLLVSRHKLLKTQEDDLAIICQKVTKVDMLPTALDELKKLIDFYDAVVGVIPVPLQLQIIQMKKAVLSFYMEAVGTTKTKEEAEQLLVNLLKSGHDGVILPPAREGEPYRVSVYRGIVRIKEIKIVDEYMIQH